MWWVKLYMILLNTAINRNSEYYFGAEFSSITHYRLEDAVEEEHQLRNHFLLWEGYHLYGIIFT
jgi:hypothetical protein